MEKPKDSNWSFKHALILYACYSSNTADFGRKLCDCHEKGEPTLELDSFRWMFHSIDYPIFIQSSSQPFLINFDFANTI